MIEFTGVGVSWDIEDSNFDDSQFLVFNFKDVKIIQVRPDAEPHIGDTADLKIKFSKAKRSNFGFFSASMDRALGLSSDQSDLDNFVDKHWHVTATPYNWGKIPGSSSVDEKGNTWGEIWTLSTVTDAGKTIIPALTAQADNSSTDLLSYT